MNHIKMKTKFENFLSEANEPIEVDKVNLKNRIHELKKWLVLDDGLGMNSIIESIWEEYKYKDSLGPAELTKFYRDLSELRKTDFPSIDYYLTKKAPGGIEKRGYIKVNNKWHYVNKVNANYSDQADMLVYLIDKLINGKSKSARKDYGLPAYDTIMSGDTKDGLLILKPKLRDIMEYYFITIGQGVKDFIRFSVNSERNTKLGERAEKLAKTFLVNKGFVIKAQGGDGDFIDMIFGCDMILFREDFGYKTIQIKSFKPEQKNIDYYKVNWIVVANVRTGKVDVLDKKTLQPINIL